MIVFLKKLKSYFLPKTDKQARTLVLPPYMDLRSGKKMRKTRLK